VAPEQGAHVADEFVAGGCAVVAAAGTHLNWRQRDDKAGRSAHDDFLPLPVSVRSSRDRSFMKVHIAESDAELEKISVVLLQLRTAFDGEGLLAQVKQQRQHGYQLAYVESAGEVLCVAGFVVGTKLAWGKHLYVDDLVTAGNRRSEGAGAKMIAWLNSHARQLGCEQLHLDSGVQRFAAHKFYLREGFRIDSHHFSIIDLRKA
jgi:GNAT superfamily N-acetyltransferase